MDNMAVTRYDNVTLSLLVLQCQWGPSLEHKRT